MSPTSPRAAPPGWDALFLDEGFCTLDAETLEVIASAIEELQARGRMVGLVTHFAGIGREGAGEV